MKFSIQAVEAVFAHEDVGRAALKYPSEKDAAVALGYSKRHIRRCKALVRWSDTNEEATNGEFLDKWRSLCGKRPVEVLEACKRDLDRLFYRLVRGGYPREEVADILLMGTTHLAMLHLTREDVQHSVMSMILTVEEARADQQDTEGK